MRVEPAEIRAAGKAVSDVAEKLRGDFTRTDGRLIAPRKELAAGFRSAAAVRTLATLWRNYLTGFGTTLDDCGDRLVLTAKAYQERDEEAAEALGVDLPEDPYQRPGRAPK